MSLENLPFNLKNILAGEEADFVVKSSRSIPLKKAMSSLFFGFVWLNISSVFFMIFLGPLLRGEEVHFTTNDVPTVAGPGNLKPIIGPALIIGLFIVIGLGILGYGIYSLVQEGGWFIGTPKRLIVYKKNKIRSIDWEQFSGDIEVRGTSEKGDIVLQMRTGKMMTREGRQDKYIPNTVYISGIENAFEIEKICRKRIEENDPTPERIAS